MAATIKERGWYENVRAVPQDFKVVLREVSKIMGGGKKIGLDFRSLSYAGGKEVEKYFGENNLVDISDIIGKLRARKDGYEIGEMKRALKITYKIFDRVMTKISPGIEDSKVHKLIKHELCEENVDGAFEAFPIFFGSRTYATDWSPYVGKKLRREDKLATIDFGVRVDSGYCSDFTRALILDSTEPVKRLFNSAMDIHEYALKVIRAGKTGKEIGKEINSYIQKKGYEVLHRPGHQIGLEDHDEDACNAPTFGSTERDNQLLMEGMVVTVEPGVYDPKNRLGVRFEDMVVVGKREVTKLTNYPYGIVI
jgi:Xaa-Pro aminopeptidase